jgi:hypothetical protein
VEKADGGRKTDARERFSFQSKKRAPTRTVNLARIAGASRF